MKIIIASKSPVKEEAVRRGFKALWPDGTFEFECVQASSSVSHQPMSDDETRTGALNRISHAREIVSDADYYVGLEGGVEEKFGDLYNFGWVVVESRSFKKGYGRTFAFALPHAIRDLILYEGMEQSYATDKVFLKSDTKSTTGTIGPITNGFISYAEWYTPAVIAALAPFFREDLYPN